MNWLVRRYWTHQKTKSADENYETDFFLFDKNYMTGNLIFFILE